MPLPACRSLNPDNRQYSISELVLEFDITTRTVPFYESKGLLSPERRGQKRLYKHADWNRLQFTLCAKRLGFSLSDIRWLIALYDGAAGDARELDQMLDRLSRSRQMLQQQRDDLDTQLKAFDELETRCHERLMQLRQATLPGHFISNNRSNDRATGKHKQ